MLARHPGADIRFVGTARGLENKIVPEEGFWLELIPVVPFSRKPSWSWVKFPFVLLQSIIKTIGLIRRSGAEVVVATGGYVSGPALVAGWLLRKPIVLCEQNSYPGFTTRAGSLLASKVCLGLPGARKHLWRKSRVIQTGNPVRLPSQDEHMPEIKTRLGLSEDRLTVLVTGGSQGAASINRAVLEMILSGKLPDNCQMLWQTGSDKFADIERRLSPVPKNVRIVPFIRPMWEAFVSSDIVVARCGALTLSEIAVFGLPAVLVPYPHAAADHQRLNALTFAGAGAAKVISDGELSGEMLFNVLNEMIRNDGMRKRMSKASKSLGRPGALTEIVNIIEEVMSKK